MPSVQLRTDVSRFAVPSLPAHPKVRLIGQSGTQVVLPFAPTIGLGAVAPSWSELGRSGVKPLLAKGAPQLRQQPVELLVGYGDHQRSVERELHLIRLLARDGDRVRWANAGPQESHGWWRITDYAQTIELRQHGTNEATRARVTMLLVQASDAKVKLGPVTGGAKGAGKRKPADGKASTYRVKGGDTLWGIAHRHYGDGQRWRRIADANGVRDPKRLQIGVVLKLPAP